MYSHAFISRLKTGIFPHEFYKSIQILKTQSICKIDGVDNDVSQFFPHFLLIFLYCFVAAKPLEKLQ